MSRPSHVEAFIQKVLPIAQTVRQTYGVPISACLAQGGLESGWNLSSRSLFGVAISGDPSRGFVQYASLEDAAMAYGKNLRYNRVYASAWVFQNDPEKFVNAIGDKYAPNQNYAQAVNKVIRDFNLTEFDGEDMLFTPSGIAPSGQCE
jgi:flagellum-specific peptidoglycan hydrolase FlgJ